MQPFSLIGIFCEDIRDEVAGTHTLIGILPDNVLAGNVPGILPRLSLYIRVQLDQEANPKTLKARMRLPDGTIFEIADFQELIRTVKKQAEEQGTPYGGLIGRGTFVSLPISKLGRIEAIVEIDGTEYICGVLNLVQSLPSTATISTASPPPA